MGDRRQKSSLHCFFPQMVTTARAGLIQSWEPGAYSRSPLWFQGSKVSCRSLLFSPQEAEWEVEHPYGSSWWRISLLLHCAGLKPTNFLTQWHVHCHVMLRVSHTSRGKNDWGELFQHRYLPPSHGSQRLTLTTPHCNQREWKCGLHYSQILWIVTASCG